MDARSISLLVTDHKDSKLQVSDNNTSGQEPGSQEPNFSEAERFLTLLDETADAFTFQTFDDSKERRNQSLARVLIGTIEEHWTELVRLNARGAGIFVTINETDLTGRKKENITRIRALWQEADRGDEPAAPDRAAYHRGVQSRQVPPLHHG